MLKSKIAMAALVSGLLLNGTANADVSPYVGAEALFNSPSVKTFNATTTNNIQAKKSKLGASLLAGAKFHENFGAEVGYSFAAKKKATSNSATVHSKFNNIYVDAMGYMPVSNEADVIGAVGLGRMKPKVSVDSETVPAAVNKAKVGARLGAGVQYKLTDNLAARAMVRYQKGNKDFIKHNTSAGLGLTWSF